NITPESGEVAHGANIHGSSYGIFRLRAPMRATICIRQDWMDDCRRAEPETPDDLMQLAIDVSEQAPAETGRTTTGVTIAASDGYGKNCEYGRRESWHGTDNVWKDDGGSLTPAFLAPEVIEANRSMRQMVEAGHVNADFATMDSATWNEPFFNGQGGLIADVSSRGLQLLGLVKDADPEGYGDKVTMVGNLSRPDGSKWSLPTPGYSGYLAIPKASVPTDAQLETVLTVLDKLSSAEGQRLLNNGIEGVNYELDGDQAVAIESDEASVIQSDVSAFAQIG